MEFNPNNQVSYTYSTQRNTPLDQNSYTGGCSTPLISTPHPNYDASFNNLNKYNNSFYSNDSLSTPQTPLTNNNFNNNNGIFSPNMMNQNSMTTPTNSYFLSSANSVFSLNNDTLISTPASTSNFHYNVNDSPTTSYKFPNPSYSYSYDGTTTSNNADIIQHNRTNSLPTSFKGTLNSNNLLRTTPSNTNTTDHCSFNINRFSLPSIADDDNYTNAPTSSSTLGIERQFNNLLLEISPSSINPTRRNTMFSNASISSTATSNSIISSTSNQNTSTIRNMNNEMMIKESSAKSTSPPHLPHSHSNPVSNSSSVSSSNSSSVDLSCLSSNDIIILSKDQHGCRMLQKKIDDDCSANLPIIFNATYKHSAALMLDPFGNYLIQKLMISATPSQLSLIIIEITPNIDKIATNLHGTRALQKLIGCISTPNHHDLMALAISPQIVGLVHDLNGNHVIQKLISHFFGDDLDFLINLIIVHLIEIASHKHGCCVLQKLLNKCSTYQIQKISNEILRNSVHLMKDQFGNYVIQYLISLDINGVNLQLLQLVAHELVSLSCGKFSSNVVEKCLKLNPTGCRFNEHNIHPLLAAVINIHTLMSLIKDQYGNYVVQTALEVADWPIKCVIAEMIRPMLPNIRYTNYGKRIHSRVVTILTELDNNNANSNANKDARHTNLLPGINFANNI